MFYDGDKKVIHPRDFVSTVLYHMKNLLWLDVSSTPELSLEWILYEPVAYKSYSFLVVFNLLTSLKLWLKVEIPDTFRLPVYVPK